MPSGNTCIPVRVKIRLQAIILWLALSLPSISVTLILYSSSKEGGGGLEEPIEEADEEEEQLEHQQESFACYENYTVYFPVYMRTRFWIEGVLLLVVGLLGICGNLLTLAVLTKSKRTKFNRLLFFLSLTDTVLIVFFLLLSACTVLAPAPEPQWFIFIFPYLLWPLGNIAITSSVLMVVAVSTERFLAICRPLQYKPSPGFYVSLVLMISFAVNLGKFFEYKLEVTSVSDNLTLSVEQKTNYKQSRLMQDERYIIFSRYWTEIVVIGILPLIALILLNYGIYTKIRKSTKFRKLHDKSSIPPPHPTGSSSTPRQATCRMSADNITSVCVTQRSETSPPQKSGSQNVTTSTVVNLPTTTLPSQANSTSTSSSSSERSTKLLVGIVLVFFVCHCFRLVLQFDAVVHPSILGGEHFRYCIEKGKFPSPFVVWIMTSFNNVFLVLNSSINFVVYCLMGRSFRTTLIDLFRVKKRQKPYQNMNGQSSCSPQTLAARCSAGQGYTNVANNTTHYTPHSHQAPHKHHQPQIRHEAEEGLLLVQEGNVEEGCVKYPRTTFHSYIRNTTV